MDRRRSAMCGAILGLAAALMCAASAQAAPAGVPGGGQSVKIDVDSAETNAPGEVTQTPEPPASPTSEASTTPEQSSEPPQQPSPSHPAPATPTRRPGTPQTGVSVRADNAVLTQRYWSGQRTASLTVTVTNTGDVAETVTLRNAPPHGVQSVSCTGRCVAHVPAGKSKAVTIRLLVDAEAWSSAPLAGTLTFTATATGGATRSGQVAWGVVFPPGPPAPGLTLRVSDVRLGASDARPVARGQFTIQVTNSGKAPGTGEVSVVAPPGVTFGALPAACHTSGSEAVTCDTGQLATGQAWEVLLSLLVPVALGTDSPLVGLVRARLSPFGQSALQTQASYQILGASPQADALASTSAQPVTAWAPPRPVTRSAPALPIIGGSVVLLILVVIGLVLTLLRRREESAPPPAREPAAAAEPAPDQPPDSTALLSAGPVNRTPTPRIPLRWEWNTGDRPAQSPPDSAPPPDPEPGPDAVPALDPEPAPDVEPAPAQPPAAGGGSRGD